MVLLEQAIQFALSLPGASQQPHFDKQSIRVKNKIFATYHPNEERFVLKLSPVDQSVFCDFNKEVFSPVNGSLGMQGWTNVNISKVPKEMFEDAVRLAWFGVAPKKLRDMLFS